MNRPHVVMIGGSERSSGNTDQLLDLAVQQLACRKVSASVYQLRELGMSGGCGACGDCNVRDSPCAVPDGVAEVVDAMSRASGIIYATPVHGFGAASLMQAFIERAGVGYLRFHRPLSGKAGLAIVTGRRFSHEHVHAQLVINMLLNRMVLAGSGFPAVVHGGAPGSWSRDLEGVANVEAALRRMAELVWFLQTTAEQGLRIDGAELARNERLETCARISGAEEGTL